MQLDEGGRKALRGWNELIRIDGTDLHERRLASADVVKILSSRSWESLRLDGELTQEVADALQDQAKLRELRLTLSSGSVPLDFVAKLPALERVVFAEMAAPAESLAPLLRCWSLREVVFDDCFNLKGVESPLKDRVKVSFATRMWR